MSAVVTAIDRDTAALADFIMASGRLFVLTGAGISTASGIPDYRDPAGAWKRRRPMTGQAFKSSIERRRRYWAGSYLGWPAVAEARPNHAHAALVTLETRSRTSAVVTQNVDRLHQSAGNRRVIDLHGRLDRLVCLSCRRRYARGAFQRRLREANPGWRFTPDELAPDGDVPVAPEYLEGFRIPGCRRCNGVLKPDVVFFGEAVPRQRVTRAFRHLAAADAVLVLGSSLMVWSGYRFAREAARTGKPIAAVNRGRTRADDLLDLKIEADCGDALTAALQRL